MEKTTRKIIVPLLIAVFGALVTGAVYREVSDNLDERRLSEFENLAANIIIKIQDEINLSKATLDVFALAGSLAADETATLSVLADEIISADFFLESLIIREFNEQDYLSGKARFNTALSISEEDDSQGWSRHEEESHFLRAYYTPPPLVGGEKIYIREDGNVILYKNFGTHVSGVNRFLAARFNIVEHLPEILFDVSPDWLDLHLLYKSDEELKDFVSGKGLADIRATRLAPDSDKGEYDFFVPGAIDLFGENISVFVRPSSSAYFETNNIAKRVIILFGAIVTFFLAMWSYMVEARRKKIEQLIEKRTAELVQANNLLVEEQKENVRLLDELKLSQQELNNVADSVAGVLFEYDYSHSRFSYVSRKIEQILEFSKGQAMSMENPIKAICLPEDYALLADSLKASAATAEVSNIEFRAVTGQGKKIWLRSISTPVFHDNGEVRFNGVLLDITEFKLMAKERSEMESQLRQAQKMEAVGQLAAGIAHEINTPAQFVGDNIHYLNDSFDDISRLWKKCAELLDKIPSDSELHQEGQDVRTFSEEIDMEFLDTDIPQSLNQSLDGVKRIAEIVGAMKEFSHPGSKEKELIDLNKAINNTVTVARNEWKYVAEVDTNFSEELPFVAVFPGEFNQVILNMIVNAAHAITEKYGDQGDKGSIAISTQKAGGSVLVSITDDGNGIPKENQEKIFDPFFTTKEVGKGTGQGLSLAFRTIVEGHQGTISVDSEEGQGTTFTIKLPVEVE